MKTPNSKHFPAIALSLAVVTLAAALACVSGCKKTPDIEPVPVPTPVATATPAPDATPLPAGVAICHTAGVAGSPPFCQDANGNVVTCPSDIEARRLPPCPVRTPPVDDALKCRDADGTVFEEGYRFAIGDQVFECQKGSFVQVELKGCTDVDGTVRRSGYEYAIGAHRFRCVDGEYVEVK